MFMANIKSLSKHMRNFLLHNQKKKKKRKKNDQVMGNSELKLKIHFKVFFKTLSKIYAEFPIAEPKKNKKNQE